MSEQPRTRRRRGGSRKAMLAKRSKPPAINPAPRRMIVAELADVAAAHDMSADADREYPPLRMSAAQVERLEAEIDAMTDVLEPLRSFILPGGSALAAHLHVCRTVARRAERLTVELATRDAVNPAATRYLNRLSDWFFVAARMANDQGRDDVLWVPGANR